MYENLKSLLRLMFFLLFTEKNYELINNFMKSFFYSEENKRNFTLHKL